MGSREHAGADAGNQLEYRPGAVLRPAAKYPCTAGIIPASAGHCKELYSGSSAVVDGPSPAPSWVAREPAS
jgi:hypothetical protein